MRAKVYLETTIPSYVTARPSRDLVLAGHQEITRQWWEQRRNTFALFISELVLQECRAGHTESAQRRIELLAGISILPANHVVSQMAERLVDEGPIPTKAAGDAVHIATATVYQCDYLLTWNCRHIANAEIQRSLRQITRQYGWELPVICTPEELMGGQYGLE